MLDQPEFVHQAVEHLRQDPRLGPLVEAHPAPTFQRAQDPFFALARIIVFQQLSGKAADTIFNRLQTLVGGTVTPQSLLAKNVEELRTAGVSRPKATYLLDLAARFDSGQIHGQDWPQMSDDEVRAEIVSIKGLGDWCADMFLMFSLCRPDVWPTGDQGIRNAAKRLLDREDHLPKSELEAFGEPFRPYRSVAATYLWRQVDTKAITTK